MKKTAAELQTQAKEMAGRGAFVPYIYPSQVERFTQHQIAHFVVNMKLSA